MEKLKVKITSVHNCDELTIGNIYDVIEVDKDDEVTPYKVMDDIGDEIWVEARQCNLIKEWQPEKGEMVEVRNYEGCSWVEREYIDACLDLKRPYAVKTRDGYAVVSYRYIRQIEKPKREIKITVDGKEVTIEELNKIVNNE